MLHVACTLIIIAVLSAPFFVLLPYRTFVPLQTPEHPLTDIVVVLHIIQKNVNRLSISLFRRLHIACSPCSRTFCPPACVPGLELFYFLMHSFLEFLLLCPFFAPYCILENMIQGGEEPGKLGAGVLFFCAVHVSKIVQQAFCCMPPMWFHAPNESETTMPSNSSSMDSATFLFLDLSMTKTAWSLPTNTHTQ